MSQRLIVIFSIIALTLGYSIYEALKLDKKLSSSQDYFSSNSVLKNLPEIDLDYFDLDKSLDLKEFSQLGNNLIIHFWATWCAPCEKELPELLELAEKLSARKDVKFLFITVNDQEREVKKFIKKYNLLKTDNTILLVDNDNYHQKSFGTYKLPETYIFSSAGKLLRKFSGAQNWNNEVFVNYLKSI